MKDDLGNRADPVRMGATQGQAWLVSPGSVDMTRQVKPVKRAEIKAQPQSIAVDLNKSALLIVDMQNDFCTKGGWMDSQGIDIMPNQAPIAPL